MTQDGTPEARALEGFKALGHPVRLAILRFIIQGHEAGTHVGDIQARVGIPASTLSHHLACLAQAGLVTAHREGTFLRYGADFRALKGLVDFLMQDCCAGGRLPADVPCCATRG